jgi:hypothetical protein
MAKVQGVKEKLHWPLYDAFFVPNGGGTPPPNFGSEMLKRDPRVLRFFVDVQNKTKLETNLQASGVLPSLNTFEARAMRVVVSPFVPEAKRPTGQPATSLMDNILADLIYSSVTTLLVGEKVMIEMPTFYFPSGAGVSPGAQNVPSHGEPDPMATFRFSEPVTIEPNQNFRVEMMFPHGVPGQVADPTKNVGLAGVQGPFRLWVVLDGYLTRDVQ